MIESIALTSSAQTVLPKLPFVHIAWQGVLVLAIRVVDAGAALVLQVCLARLLGPLGYGSYAYAFAWLQLALVFSHGGFATAALRYLAEYRARQETSLARGFLRRGFQISLLESVGLALVMAGAVVALRHRLSDQLFENLLITSLAIPVFSQSGYCRAAIRGLGHKISSMSLDLVQQLLLIGALLSTAYLFRASVSSSDALLLCLGSGVCAFGLIYAMQCRFQHGLDRGPTYMFRTREWLSTATQMMLMQGLIYVQGRTGVIVSGLLLDDRAAGIYAAMERLSDVALLGVFSVNYLAAPTFAALHAQGRQLELQRYARLAAWGATLFMLLTALPLIFFGRTVALLFGDGFVAGYPVLLVLLVGVAVNAMCGSACLLLNMTGHQRQTILVAFGSLCLNLILLLMLVPQFGIIGTAVAFALSTAVSSVLMLLIVRRRIGIWTCLGDIR